MITIATLTLNTHTVNQLQQLMELQEQNNNELKCRVNKLSTDLTNREAELSRLRDELGQQIKLNRQLEEQRSQFSQAKKQNTKLQEELERVVKKVRMMFYYTSHSMALL